jgi:hypothetical protein
VVTKVRLTSFVLIALILGGLGWQGTFAQSEQGEYFEATGHYVAGEFLDFYHSVPNPQELYGNPITEVFIDATSGRPIQYFEKARFELYSDTPAGRRVQLSPLGEYLYESGLSLNFEENACRVFPRGYRVCYDFLTFYDKNGGEAQFGLPLSNAEIQGGRIVQYFDNARFEFQAGATSGRRIKLGNLGSQYFNLLEAPSRRDPVTNGNIVDGIIDLKARAFPATAITKLKSKQTIYIIVKDQRRFPIADAIVTMVVRMPSGKESSYIVPVPTSAQGVTQHTFNFESGEVGTAVIRVTATYKNLKTQTITSFRIWW